ncbi:uncharacterized protein LOC110460309 [Mizuhopecten yessoensis]|uniref:UBZ1-type domain-containing protein n=1 Tax=Mizuhopecten yessoensis TaxID=6573 RepID=A0A210Q2Q4_MIZYE|nr:uncharacterized protein LOC110460309 [Mizuhopecten yessoensis]XP_021368816.1 uncharacterized protein LOC110460309 [Mizuhopecten yessoensis]XP_021368818.1 uncharacterized protein LOC110460309 [Mizuhopecten yessoensis]OWF43016.1 hypothetical protein KP79_PYT04988 [Mizuhopecten yessoensis]
MNGEDDIAVLDQQEDIDNLGYPVPVTDDFQSNLQLYISTGKPENDAASLHALRNAYHDLKLRYNEQTAKVHSMRQAIKDMEAQRIQNTNRPFIMNTTALAGAAGAGNQTASGAVEPNPHLRANLGYADSLQRQILRLKNTSAGREKEMERKYSDLYTKYKRLEADVNTLQLRNRKTTAELEKSANLLKDRDMLIEQLSDRKDLLEKKVGRQNPESFSEESRLQEKHMMGIMEYQTKYIDELKEKVQEQNSIINKQLDMIKTFCRNQKEAEAAASRNSDYQIQDSARRPDGESLLPLNVLEQHGAGARPRQSGALTISAQTHLQNTGSSPPSSSRQQYVPNQLDTPVYSRESLAEVEARRQNNSTLHQNFADARISRGPVMVQSPSSNQLPVPAPQPSHDAPDSPVLNRSPKMSSPKIPVNPSGSSYSMARYLDQQPGLRLEDASVLPDTIYQPSSDGRQGPMYENDQRLQALRIDDKKLTLNDTIYRSAAPQGSYTRLEDSGTVVLYPPLPSSQEANYENIKVFLPPTQEQANGDYANVSALIGRSDQSNGSNTQKCPVCNKNFLTTPIDKFQQHVLDCMDVNEEEGTPTLQNVSQGENGRECPMCTAVFPGGLPQEEFERHVQEHFGEDPMMERFEVLQA